MKDYKMSTISLTKYATGFTSLLLFASCSSTLSSGNSDGHIQNVYSPITMMDANGVVAQSLSASSADFSSSALPVFVLTATIAPPAGMQATDVTYNAGHAYTSYTTRDTTGLLRAGAIEHDALSLSILGITVNAGTILRFPTTNIYQSYSDGTNLYAVGSDRTASTSAYASYGRIFKMPLSSSKDLSTISATATLPSYAGTGVTVVGTKVYATSGTSSTTTDQGGLTVLNTADFSSVGSQTIYDARNVSYNINDLTTVYVTRAPNLNSSGDTAKVIPYTAAGAVSSAATSSGLTGNNITESKSNVIVGRNLIIASQGDKGFSVICKSTGVAFLTVAPPVISGLTAAQTVTNSVTASPGYLFVANGEAGVYVYPFQRTSAGNSALCNNVTLGSPTWMATSTSQAANANGILSANQVSYFTLVNALNVVTAKFLLIASGNKGTSVVTMAVVAPGSTDIDDF